MKTLYTLLKSSTVIVISLGAVLSTKAQSTLEFINSSASTSATGPSVASQAITFFENRTNGTYAAFASPTTTATVSLSNQQYTMTPAQIATRTGSSFGTNVNGFGTSAGSLNLYMSLGSVGGASSSNFTAVCRPHCNNACSILAAFSLSATTTFGIAFSKR